MLPNLILKIEKWKFNKEYGVYVSTLGNFKDRHKRLIPVKINQSGYCMIKVEGTIPFKPAHRLVMLTWKPIANAEDLTVDHLNHNKRDNSLDNLEWVSYEENQLRARNDRISYEETPKVFYSPAEIEEPICIKKSGRITPFIDGYQLDGEGHYQKEELIEKLISIRGENTRKTTKKAFKAFENGTNLTGSKKLGQYTITVIYNKSKEEILNALRICN